jgi:hypothetical protein
MNPVAAPERPESRGYDRTIEPSAAPLIVAFLALVVAFLLFAGGALADTRLISAMPRQGWLSGFSWLWIPALITLSLGILFAWGLREEATERAAIRARERERATKAGR